MDENTKKNYPYKYVSIYFDMSNPYQKECYELLQMINKKKSLFLGMLAHNFLKQFSSSTISKEDLTVYIKSYDLLCKFENAGLFQNINPVDAIHQISDSETKISGITLPAHICEETVFKDIPSKEPKYGNKETILAAMGAFSVD